MLDGGMAVGVHIDNVHTCMVQAVLFSSVVQCGGLEGHVVLCFCAGSGDARHVVDFLGRMSAESERARHCCTQGRRG